MSPTHRILVVSPDEKFGSLINKAFVDNHEITFTAYENTTNTLRNNIFDVIIISAEIPEESVKLYRKLHENWMTRHIPCLVVDTRSVESAHPLDKIPAANYLLFVDLAQLTKHLNTLLAQTMNTLKDAILDTSRFAITWEQIPGRGAMEKQQADTIENTRRVLNRGKTKIHGISVTDNPGGNPAIATEMLCTEIKRIGMEPLVHIALRDKNRNQVESLLSGLAANNVRNLLLLTGDYPATSAFGSKSKPVFDLDAAQGLQLVEKMNLGLEYENLGKKTLLKPTDFFAGTAVSPFKILESELMGQYFKLKKKIEAGAKFVILQVGYDARKMHEVLTWLKVNNYNLPAIANIYVLPYGAGKIMNAGDIPGCVVTDGLLSKLNEERKLPDKGKQARLDRAAAMYAIARGMGYAGAHLGGHGISYDAVEYILQRGEELLPQWQDLLPEFDYPQKNGFYLFERDSKTGLNTEMPSARNSKGKHPPVYLISRAAHATLFNPRSIIFKSLRPAAKRIDKTRICKHLLSGTEHLAKVILFGCQNCGDCGLFDVAFLCPLSQCPKNQRNGPCGGSLNGWCEVYPNERQCIWVKAYDRLKGHHREQEIGDHITPPNDWDLQFTSSWLNFYLGRDHSAKRLGIKPPGEKPL